MCHILGLNVVVLTSSSSYLVSLMCTGLMCHILGLKVVVLISSSRYLVSLMCSVLMCHIIGLKVVVLISSLADVYLPNVSYSGPQCSSTDI